MNPKTWLVMAGVSGILGVAVAQASPVVLRKNLGDIAPQQVASPPAPPAPPADTTAPTLVSVTAPANRTYSVGENIDFTVTWSENVTVTGTPHIPLIVNALVTGATQRSAQYVSTSGNQSLFRYAVTNGDNDKNGIMFISNIALNGGAITDAANNAYLPVYFDPPDTSLINIDTVIPTLASLTPPVTDNYSPGSSNLDFTLSFSEPVTATYSTAPRIALTIGNTTRYATLQQPSGTTASSFTFRYATVNADSDTNGIAFASPNLDLNGGSFADEVGLALSGLTLPSASLSGVNVMPGAGCWRVITTSAIAGDSFIVGKLTMRVGGTDVTVGGDTATTFSGSFSSSVIGGHEAAKAFDGSLASPDYATNQYFLTTASPAAGAYLGFAFDSLPALNDMQIHLNRSSSYTDLEVQSSLSTGCNNGAGTWLTVASVPKSSLPANAATLIDLTDYVPTMTALTPPSSGRYNPGTTTLTFTATFNENVTVTYASAPRIALNIGGNTRYATLNQSSGTTARNFTFSYATVSGDLDEDGIAFASSSLDLNGGSFVDATGNAMVNLSLPSATVSGVLVAEPLPQGCWRIVTTSTSGEFYVGKLEMRDSNGVDLTVAGDTATAFSGPFSSTPLNAGEGAMERGAVKAFDGLSYAGRDYFGIANTTAGGYLGFAFDVLPTLQDMRINLYI